MRDSYKVAVNIENNRKTSGELGRRDDPKLFNPKNNNRKEANKTPIGKKLEEPTIAQVLEMLKKMNPKNFNAHKSNVFEKIPINNNNYNRQPRMKNYLYTTQWKDGKPVPNQTQNLKDKGTPDTLQRNIVNMSDDVPWCIICQYPYSSFYCAISQSLTPNQGVQLEEENEEKSHDDISCNMVSMYDDFIDSDFEQPEKEITSQRVSYHLHHQQVLSDDEGYDKDKVCVTSSDVGHVILRMLSEEEIDRITTEMICQVHNNYNLRNRIVNNDFGKYSGIFIKDITHKMNDENKKVKVDVPTIKENKFKKSEPEKKVQFQIDEKMNVSMQGKKSKPDTIKKTMVHAAQKPSIVGIIVKPATIEPIDMIAMLSQITVKVPLSKLLRIEEHKSKALSWLGGIDASNVVKQNIIQLTPLVVEDSGILSQIP